MSRAWRLLAAGLLAALALAPPAAAAEPTFGSRGATATFGEGIDFRQEFSSPVALARVELLLEFPEAIGPFVVEVAGPTPAGSHEVSHRWSLAGDGHIVPNTPITARWRLVPADRSDPSSIGPASRVVYRDTRFRWSSLTGDLVRLHWHEGSGTFGRRALEIGDKAVRDAAAFLGVTESEPIDFYVYAEEKAFYDALGPGTPENVGGQAHAAIRTMFALIGPSSLDDPWVDTVIPHELAHLVFDTAVRNPYHSPPRWLNEGVAVYLSEGYTTSDRRAVERAVDADELMPLRALLAQFPTTLQQFPLAYAESVSAIDYMVREVGTDGLVRLIRSYADGVTDDEAFRAALGSDLAGFEAAWLKDLGAKVPTEHGPREAPTGPLPPGWENGPSPGAPSSSPIPTGSPAFPASPAPASSPSPGGGDAGGSSTREGWFLAGVAAAGILVGGAIAFLRRRRTVGGPGGTAA